MIISARKKILFINLILLLTYGSCGKSNFKVCSENVGKTISLCGTVGNTIKKELQQNATERHAFIMADGLVFIADIPKDWRYALSPVYDYTYCGYLGDYNETNCKIRFLGIGEDDSEDNFFEITVKKGQKAFVHNLPVTTVEPFIFQDGTKGEWTYQIGELPLHYRDGNEIFYEGLVQDLEKKYSIYFCMLKDEYDANKDKIMAFLKSACFRVRDLGVERENDFLGRELLTLHIVNRYMRFSVELPEGVMFEKREFNNTDSYRTCSYTIYLDKEKKAAITFQSDQGGGIQDRTGDYKYYLNTKDFRDTVYELQEGGYYFSNYNFIVRTRDDGENEETWEYLKRIVQSIRFE